MPKKLLIFADVHYPIGSFKLMKRIISREKPDNVALLGDNIELSLFKGHRLAYGRFLMGFDRIFPIRKSIVMVGDNDFSYSEEGGILDLIDSYSPINKGANLHIYYKIGSMNFFHGNLEKSQAVEKLGYYFVKAANRLDHTIAPRILSSIARFRLGVRDGDYLFLGHLHYLGSIGNTVFCGTLNYKFMPFPDSLGYVTIMHKEFVPLKKKIKLEHVMAAD